MSSAAEMKHLVLGANMPVLPNKISFSHLEIYEIVCLKKRTYPLPLVLKGICYSLVIPRAFCTVLILEVDSFKASL